jgi:phenylpyruvate tautomerase PptA (4-oxalocrotonate tautomerase family)
MPFIQVKTTKPLSAEIKEFLTKELCSITEDCLGKGANWIMTGYEDGASLSFQGSGDPIAYIEVKCYGKPQASAADAMTAKVCTLMEKELQIPASRVYVSYWGTDMWGWNGNNF